MNVYLSLVSQDGRAIPESVVYIYGACGALGFPIATAKSESTMLTSARTHTLEQIKKLEGKDKAFVIFLDSDIKIAEGCLQYLTDYINKASKLKINIIGNYMRGDLRNTISNEKGEVVTDEERNSMEDLCKIDSGGLGFAIIPEMDLNYKFHMSDSHGEDYNMFHDLKLELRYAKNLKLGHKKSLMIYEDRVEEGR